MNVKFLISVFELASGQTFKEIWRDWDFKYYICPNFGLNDLFRLNVRRFSWLFTGFLVVTSGYLIATTGYFSVFLVTSFSSFSLSNNGQKYVNSHFQKTKMALLKWLNI